MATGELGQHLGYQSVAWRVKWNFNNSTLNQTQIFELLLWLSVHNRNRTCSLTKDGHAAERPQKTHCHRAPLLQMTSVPSRARGKLKLWWHVPSHALQGEKDLENHLISSTDESKFG